MQGERQAAKAKRLGEIKVCAGILSERSTAAYRRTKEPLPKCLPGAEMSMSHSKFRRASASPDREGLLMGRKLVLARYESSQRAGSAGDLSATSGERSVAMFICCNERAPDSSWENLSASEAITNGDALAGSSSNEWRV